MTTKREQILTQIQKAGVITLDDLADALPGQTRRQVIDNVKACIDDGLALRDKDVVTGQPCYTLTPLGRKRLKDGPGSHIKRRSNGSVTQAGSGANNPGSQASESLVEVGSAANPPEGLTVVEQPKPDEAPVEAGSDVIVPPAPAYDPDAVCFDAQKREAAKDADIERLRSIIDLMSEDHHKATDLIATLTKQRQAWREVAYEVECETPDGLREHTKDLKSRIADLESNHELPLEMPSTVKYGVILPGEYMDLCDSPESAIASACELDCAESIGGATVAEIRVIGHVQNKPVFVPRAA